MVLILFMAGMFVHYSENTQNKECTIVNKVKVPANTAYMYKRKMKKNEHNQFYKNRAGFF